MSDGVGVEFVGGPLDGERHWLVFASFDPPETWSDAVRSVWVGPEIGDVEVQRLTYRRRVNMDPCGPPWLFDFVRADPERPVGL